MQLVLVVRVSNRASDPRECPASQFFTGCSWVVSNYGQFEWQFQLLLRSGA